MAAVGWGIIEPLLPAHLARAGLSPAVVVLISTIGSIAYGASAPLVAWVSNHAPIRKLVAGGAVAMAIALPFLSLYRVLSQQRSACARSASVTGLC